MLNISFRYISESRRKRLIPVRNYLDDSYRYTFGGKEEQPELGLNWIDHHARNYMPDLGRWMNPDPLAEEYSSWSPYNYVMNSPLRFIDPTGMFIEPPTKPGEFEGDVHFDEDTGASFVWDGQGNWHSDMQDGFELEEVFIANENSSGNQRGENSGVEMGISLGEKLDIGIGALGISIGVKNELFGFASKSGELSSGAMKYLKYSKGLGYVGAGMTTTYTSIQAGSYYYNGGADWQVGAKAGLDVTMTIVGFFGPVGFGISATYFLLDATGSFGEFGQIKP